MYLVIDILGRVFLILLCAGSVVGLLIGAGLLFKPERIVSLNQRLSPLGEHEKDRGSP